MPISSRVLAMPATASLARSSGSAPRPAKGGIRRSNEALILRAPARGFAPARFAGARALGIAVEAALPKPNLHYYFRSKRQLYRAVLDNILRLWLSETDVITQEAEP